ncbi:MAG: ArnT family glycosyltransferase, partial [Ignavibacteria bacterium]
MNLLSGKSSSYYFILLFVVSFAFRLFFILIYKFDGFYGQDSYAYYEYSKIFIESATRFQIPPNFFWPMGFYLFTSVFTLITDGDIGLAALLVSLNAGALCSGAVYLVSYELLQGIYSEEERKKASLYSGIILCFSPILVKSSIVIMSDALGLLFAVCGVFYFVKYTNRQKLFYIAASFAFISVSIMTRYAYLIIIIPLAVYLVYLKFSKAERFELKLNHLLISVFIGVLIFSPQLYYILNYGVPNLQYEGEIG